jgi:hypothetical protein
MKPLSFCWVACAVILLVLCTSFTSGKESVVPRHRPAFADNAHYYFYLASGDTYDGFYTTTEEIDRLEAMYDVYVDNDPFGGTILSRGYVIKGTPHLIGASIFLYGHF